jgi:hypothetical protein
VNHQANAQLVGQRARHVESPVPRDWHAGFGQAACGNGPTARSAPRRRPTSLTGHRMLADRRAGAGVGHPRQAVANPRGRRRRAERGRGGPVGVGWLVGDAGGDRSRSATGRRAGPAQWRGQARRQRACLAARQTRIGTPPMPPTWSALPPPGGPPSSSASPTPSAT